MADSPASQEASSSRTAHGDDTFQTVPATGNSEAKTIRKRKPHAKGTTLDGHDMRKVRELGLEKALPKEWRKKVPNRVAPPVGGRKRKTAEDAMTDERLIDLFSSSVISDVQHAASKATGAGFESKNRKNELSRLANESGCLDDKTLINNAIKKFNTTPRIADDGSWKVKGLRKGLKTHQVGIIPHE